MFQGPTLREYAGFNNNNICVTALECQGSKRPVRATLLQGINRLGKAGKENREFLLYVSKRNSRMVEPGMAIGDQTTSLNFLSAVGKLAS